MDIKEIYEKDVKIEDVEYDSFIFNHRKIVVLKNEALFEQDYNFKNNEEPADSKNAKRLILAALESMNSCNILIPLSQEDYENASAYYVKLKKSFLEE